MLFRDLCNRCRLTTFLSLKNMTVAGYRNGHVASTLPALGFHGSVKTRLTTSFPAKRAVDCDSFPSFQCRYVLRSRLSSLTVRCYLRLASFPWEIGFRLSLPPGQSRIPDEATECLSTVFFPRYCIREIQDIICHSYFITPIGDLRI